MGWLRGNEHIVPCKIDNQQTDKIRKCITKVFEDIGVSIESWQT